MIFVFDDLLSSMNFVFEPKVCFVPRLAGCSVVWLGSLRVQLRLLRWRSVAGSEIFGSSVSPSTAAFAAPGFQLAGVVVIVAYVGVWHAVVVKVVLFVASGGGGSRARPTMLAEWRLPARRGWRPRVEHSQYQVGRLASIRRDVRRRGRRRGAAGPRVCPGWGADLVIMIAL